MSEENTFVFVKEEMNVDDEEFEFVKEEIDDVDEYDTVPDLPNSENKNLNGNLNIVSKDTASSSNNSNPFVFVENELFRFLNAPENLQGRIVLGKYQRSRTVDYNKLKDLLILQKLNEEPYTYKITNKEFLIMRKQIVELFPTEKRDFFYVPSHTGTNKKAVGARGCLYNHYKYLRKQLRQAGILSGNCKNIDPDSPKGI